jgi:hypothetical protein
MFIDVSVLTALRLVMIISLVGLILHDVSAFVVLYYNETFPTDAFWASSFFLLIGGGVTTLIPVLYAVVADVTPPGLR